MSDSSVTVRDCLQLASRLDGEEARRETEVLLCWALQKDRTWLYTWPDRDVEPAALKVFTGALDRRARGEPVAYITGQKDFWSLSLSVSPAVLIPRADTETLVEVALDLLRASDCTAPAILDMGTGSGAIALALASELEHARVLGLDCSPDALHVAQTNAGRNQITNVRFVRSDWFSGLGPDERFDLIVSNPPYIEKDDPHLQQGDLRYEPRSALVADNQGMADFDKIAAGARRYLCAKGWLCLEHGWQQGRPVRELLEDLGYSDIQTHTDLAGRDRVTVGCYRETNGSL